MKLRLQHFWEVVSSGYWFVPSVMSGVASILALLLVTLDRNVLDNKDPIPWLYTGGFEGAKTLLSTVAGSVITVAGVVFSITIAALTQASAQFGPRLLRNFMRDTANQVVLGTFVATFLYCLMVLRAIHGPLDDDGTAFVPQMSVTGAVLLAIASIAVMIYFIHHVSVSLQAPIVVANVRADLLSTIDRVAMTQEGSSTPTPSDRAAHSYLPPDFEGNCCGVLAPRDGYLQAVDFSTLVGTAAERNFVTRMDCRAGDYVIAGTPLLHVHPSEACTPAVTSVMSEAFIIGDQRTSEQDVEYAARQLVEIAVRALSPGINDPFTAVNCIDALGSGLCLIARRGLAGPLRYDAEGVLRLVLPVSTYAGIADLCFNQIRQYGRDSVAVNARLLEVIAACAPDAAALHKKTALLRHAEMVYRQSQDETAIPEERDRRDLMLRWHTTKAAIENPVPPPVRPQPVTT